MKTKINDALQNFVILLLMLTGLKNMLVALPIQIWWMDKFDSFYIQHINPSAATIHGIFSFLLGFIMVIFAYRLYKRVRIAWIIQIISLFCAIAFQLVHFHRLSVPILFIEAFVIAVLLLSLLSQDFFRSSDKSTVKLASILIIISFSIITVFFILTVYFEQHRYSGFKILTIDFWKSVQLLIFMNRSNVFADTRKWNILINLCTFVNWSCIISAIFLLLKPLVHDISENNISKARNLVLKYGQNPMAYLSLEDDKKYFFGDKVEGVVSYTRVGNVMVCCGDIICDSKDATTFLGELMWFCKKNDWDIIFINITEEFLELYKASNFGSVKYGEDACFLLSEYNLVGGKVAKVRAAINHANKKGITVSEYKPKVQKNNAIEKEIGEISKEWLSGKATVEMSFMLGSVGLDNPMDKRYFYALDENGKMLGFVVMIPYLNKKGYLADVTRRRQDAPQGVLEKIIYDSFMVLKEEGVIWGNMGLCPLFNVATGDQIAITERLFAYIYENLNHFYGFKTLFHAKKKYAPTTWEPRYLAYYPKIFKPNYAYAIVKAQNPKGLTELLFPQVGQKKPNNES